MTVVRRRSSLLYKLQLRTCLEVLGVVLRFRLDGPYGPTLDGSLVSISLLTFQCRSAEYMLSLDLLYV